VSHYKPYPAYKDSGVEWIGEVPEGWEVKPLKVVVSCNDDSVSETAASATPIRYVDISAVSHNEGIGSTEAMLFGDAPSRARRKAKTGDVIISTVRTYLKAVAAVDDRYADCVYSTGFAVLRARNGQVKPSFLKWLALNELFIQSVESHSEGLSYPAINAPELVNLKAVIPSLSEQTVIASILDRETARIDALISKKTRFIELLKEKRSALITHAVTKGLDPNAKMKDSGVEWIGDVPAHWSVQPIKYLASVGNGSTPSKDEDKYWENGTFPWLTSGCVNLEVVDSAEQFITHAALHECHLPIITPPAVLVGITGQGKTRGMASTLMIEATINQHIAFLKPSSKNIRTEILREFLNAAYEWLRFDSDGVGSTKGAITCEQLGNTRISLPLLSEQKGILDFISRQTNRIDCLTSRTQRSIDLLKERRSALITAAVTGQIDLRN
jgi:type I restriction enzyme S subunit